MLMRFLSLFLIFPLLVPPGMCVCHFAEPGTPAQQDGDPSTAPCSRCSHRLRSIPAQEQASSGLQTSPLPLNVPQDHLPGCPAAKEVVLPRLVESNRIVLPPDLFAAANIAIELAATPAPSPASTPCFSQDSLHLPLYLSLRTLRI